MTNFSQSSSKLTLGRGVLALALASVAVCGCDSGDGAKELADGRAAYSLHDLVKAEKMFSAAVKCSPTNVDALVNLARTELDLGKLNEAVSAIRNAEVEAAADLDVKQLGAQIAWHLKDYEKSLRLYKSIAEDTKLSAEIRADGWTGIGIVRMAMGEPHLARLAFLRAIRLNYKNASARYHLGLVYRDSPFGYNEAALEQFEFYVRMEKLASPRVQKVQRTIIPGLKETIASEAAARPGAASRNSSASAAALVQAETAWKKKQYKVAMGKYEEALKSDPLSFPAAAGLAQAFLVFDKSKTGRMKAFEKMKLACTLRPSAIKHYLATGKLAVELGLYAQAVEIYSRTFAANASSITAIDGMIVAMRKTGSKQQQALAREYQLFRETMSRKR